MDRFHFNSLKHLKKIRHSIKMRPGMSHPELQVNIPFYLKIILNKDVPLIWDRRELIVEKEVKTEILP